MKVEGAVVERIAAELESVVRDRCEWYGLDNWAFSEIVEFVLERVPEPERRP